MRNIRLHLHAVGQPDFPMHIDLVIGDDGIINHDVPVYTGWIGRPRSNEVYPFIYRKDLSNVWGLDFGSSPGSDQNGRVRRFDLIRYTVERGAKLYFFNHDNDEDLPDLITYLMKDAICLASLQSIFV